MAEYPDAEIQPGANPEHPKAHSVEGLARASHREYYVIFSIRGGWFAIRATGMAASEGVPTLDVYLIPSENHVGGAVWQMLLERSCAPNPSTR